MITYLIMSGANADLVSTLGSTAAEMVPTRNAEVRSYIRKFQVCDRGGWQPSG